MWSKESRQSRGYGKEWGRVRKVVMTRDEGLCQPCKRKGEDTAATAVDHIVSKAKAATLQWSQSRIDDPFNLQAICHDCHKVKTVEEQGRKVRPVVKVGSDGWPITEAV